MTPALLREAGEALYGPLWQSAIAREPRLLSPRARGIVRIVRTWERLHARGVNSAYRRALTEAEVLATELNARPHLEVVT